MERRDTLPHALLIQGRPGLGKTHLALGFAKRLLCEVAQGPELACGACPPCGWFERGNHPDFRLVQPDALIASSGREGADRSEGGEASTSKQIRIDQVRDLQAFLRIGTHRGGLRVALIRPAEAMNPSTANALLKSLEEPPPATLMLLVSSDPQRLLPTVRSRCQGVPVPVPDKRVASEWLASQGIANAEAALGFAGGAPLAAMEQADRADERAVLVGLLATPGLDPVRGAEQLLGTALPDVVIWIQKWVYDLARVRAGGDPRYHPGASEKIAGLAGRADPIRLTRLANRIAEARAVAQHPLNPKLFLEDLLMQYRKLSGAPDGG
ncbi:MAG: DNA polymerase III subunit delta' [Betaproteobacteria bacterium]|nr:DNA polymerase III subunit delta' [Betaproteobacteria bacterium]